MWARDASRGGAYMMHTAQMAMQPTGRPWRCCGSYAQPWRTTCGGLRPRAARVGPGAAPQRAGRQRLRQRPRRSTDQYTISRLHIMTILVLPVYITRIYIHPIPQHTYSPGDRCVSRRSQSMLRVYSIHNRQYYCTSVIDCTSTVAVQYDTTRA